MIKMVSQTSRMPLVKKSHASCSHVFGRYHKAYGTNASEVKSIRPAKNQK